MKFKYYLGLILLISVSQKTPCHLLSESTRQLLMLSMQQVLVVADQGTDNKGQMFCYQKNGGKWYKTCSDIPVVLGRNGLNKQKEGDQKSPSGIFKLARTFGYSSEAPAGVSMPWVALKTSSLCIDDPDSKYYNQIVDSRDENIIADWKSAEKMRRDVYDQDNLYELGLIPEVSSKIGSCVFIHVWRGEDKPTVGCTAMSREKILELIQWLSPDMNPVIIQGDKEQIQNLQKNGFLQYHNVSD